MSVVKIKTKDGVKFKAEYIHRKIRYTKTFDTYKKALAWKVSCKRRILENKAFGLEINDQITLDELFELFIKTKKDKKKQTISTYNSLYRTTSSYFKKISTISEIKKEHMDGLKGFLIDNGLARATINLILGFYRTLFEFATKRDLLLKNPFYNLDRVKVDKNNYKFWTKDLIEGFLLNIQDDKFYLIIKFAWLTGLRRGELCALKWKNLYKNEKGMFYFKISSQKMPDGTFATLKGGKTRFYTLNEEQAKFINSIENNNEFIFNYKSKSIDPGALSKHFNKLQDNLEIIDKIRFHDIRHSFATHHANNGCNIRKLQRVMGHSSVAITEKYAHFEDF